MKKVRKRTEKKKKKVLQYIPGYGYGGIETVTMLLNRELFRKYSFTYLVEKDVDKNFQGELKKYGSVFIRIPNLTSENKIRHILAIRRIIRDGKYDVVHVHDANIRFFVMIFARLYGVNKRVFHIHSKRIENNNILKRIGFRINVALATDIVACSTGSLGMLSKHNRSRAVVVYNAIDDTLYRYDAAARARIRKQYNILNTDLLLGSVGRLAEVKNQMFLLKILESRKENTKLLLVGDGPMLEKLKEMATELRLSDRVFFVGARANVADYYSAMDTFCLPSYSEGCPMVVLEAQANGVSVVVSSAVSEEFGVNSNFRRCSMKFSVDEWNSAIDELNNRRSALTVRGGNFCIETMSKKIARLYER